MAEKQYAHLAPNYVVEAVRAALQALGVLDNTSVAALKGLA
jgi:hypothetical protein